MQTRMKYQIISIVLTLLWTVDNTECIFGQKCSSSSMCSSKYSILFEAFECIDGVCQCIPEIEMRYGSLLSPICDDPVHAFTFLEEDCRKKGCGTDEECVEYSSSLLGGQQRHKCACKAGFIRIHSGCREGIHQNAMEPCYVPKDGMVLYCNVKKNSICRNRKCGCFEPFFANTTSGKCEPKENYIRAHNLTAYRVKPNEYCYSSSDCISGLVCKSSLCKCPEPCTYNNTTEICDCGVIESGDVIAPAILGILLGLIIVTFWYWMIRRTFAKFAKKKNSYHGVTATEEVHALEPLSSQTTARGSIPQKVTFTPPGITNPSQEVTTSHQDVLSPPQEDRVLSDDNRQEGNTYAVPPPQLSDYDLSTPQVSSAFPSVAPPPYSSLAPSGSSLPYSLNPLEGSVNVPVPNSSIPSAPYSSNASPVHFPVSGSAASPYPSTLPYAPNPPVPYPSAPYPPYASQATHFGFSAPIPNASKDLLQPISDPASTTASAPPCLLDTGSNASAPKQE